MGVVMGETSADTAESENLSMRQHSNRENREVPSVSESLDSERSANVSDGTANMYAGGKSDGSVVLTTTANNGVADAPAESDEGRDPAERNVVQDASHRTLCRTTRALRTARRALSCPQGQPISRLTQGRSRMR